MHLVGIFKEIEIIDTLNVILMKKIIGNKMIYEEHNKSAVPLLDCVSKCNVR